MEAKELKMLQALPLDIKIAKSLLRIQEWIDYHGKDKVYLSFSGGLDSTILAHLVKRVYPEIPLVFCDTGLEFPELREFVLKQKNVVILKPKLTFPEVIKRYGYPIISKEVSLTLHKLRDQNLSPEFRDYLMNGKVVNGKKLIKGVLPKKYRYLLDADYKINNACCEVMKKRPFHKYEKETGRIAPFTGEIAEESENRKRVYLSNGCNAFNRKSGPKSTPIGFWTRNDVLEYKLINNIEIPSVYGDVVLDFEKTMYTGVTKNIYKNTGEQRTGCVYCLYGCHMEDKNNNRFIRLKQTHPSTYDYCMRGGKHDDKGMWIPDKGLGLAHVLDTLNIEYK